MNQNQKRKQLLHTHEQLQKPTEIQNKNINLPQIQPTRPVFETESFENGTQQGSSASPVEMAADNEDALRELKNAYINELVYLCIQEDEDSFRHLWDLCSPICVGVYADLAVCAKEVPHREWMKEGEMILDHAIRRFRTNNGNSFQTFYRTLLRRKAMDLLRRHSLQLSRQPVVSFFQDRQDHPGLSNMADPRVDVHNQVLSDICIEDLFARLQQAFSAHEMKVFVLLMQGFSKSEVVRQLDITRYRLNQILRQSREICTEAEISVSLLQSSGGLHSSTVLL